MTKILVFNWFFLYQHFCTQLPNMNDTRYVKLWIMIVLTIIYFIVQIVMSHVTHSLTLLASSYQMFYNILNLLGCIASIKMSREQTLKNTFGWARIEVLSLLCSVLFLAALCFGLVVEAIQTLVHVSHQDAMHYPVVVFGIAIAGILLNLFCFYLLGGYTHVQGCFLHVQGSEVKVSVVLKDESNGKTSDQNAKDDFKILDFLRDVSSSVIVVICCCLVYFFEGKDIDLYADPLLSFLTVVLLIGSTFPFVKQSGMILLQTVPDDMDVNSLRNRLKHIFPSIDVHEIHVWRLTRDKIIATAHIVFSDPNDFRNLTTEVHKFFHKEGISHLTLQPEFSPVHTSKCVLGCRNKKFKCKANQCCPSDCIKEEEDESDKALTQLL